jgi:hypothetical protein
MPPFPRRFRPIGVYGGGYWGYWGYSPDLWFGLPFFFDFGYFNWSPCSPCSGSVAQAMLLYLNDGSALEIMDYWVEGDTLYYVRDDGRRGSVLLGDVDVQRTTEADARLGFRFILDRTQRGLPLDRIEPEVPPAQVNPPGPPDSGPS